MLRSTVKPRSSLRVTPSVVPGSANVPTVTSPSTSAISRAASGRARATAARIHARSPGADPGREAQAGGARRLGDVRRCRRRRSCSRPSSWTWPRTTGPAAASATAPAARTSSRRSVELIAPVIGRSGAGIEALGYDRAMGRRARNRPEAAAGAPAPHRAAADGLRDAGRGHQGAADHRDVRVRRAPRAVLRRALDLPRVRPRLRLQPHPGATSTPQIRRLQLALPRGADRARRHGRRRWRSCSR